MTFIDLLKGNDFSVNTSSMLKQYGNEKIIEIIIGRVELSTALRFLLSITSLGEFDKRSKEVDIDKLFHLFLYIKTQKGHFILEKNDVITLSKKNIPSKSDTMNVPMNVSSQHTMNSLLEKTKSFMRNDFFSYSGSHNNCQVFIDSILKTNGLSNQEISKFILQDTRHLFSNNPRFRKLSNTVTDIAAINHRVNDLGYNPIRGIGNHLLHKVGNVLNIQDQMKKVNFNPFRQFKY